MADVHRYAADLARDLGAPDRTDPIDSILAHADDHIDRLRQHRACSTLSTLVSAVADKLGMRFEIVESDDDLVDLQRRYAADGETGFVALALSLQAPDCYGGTVGLKQPRRGIRYVAVIDCRGPKRFRSYFTKCHEIAHILIATKQQLLVYRGSHAARNHPEEQLVDRVASRLGFYPRLLEPYFIAPLSFELVNTIISEMCPEASWESAVRGVVTAWPAPAAWFRATLGLKRSEQARSKQRGFSLLPDPAAKLRISDTPAHSIERPRGFDFHQKMRIPPQSVIASVFAGASHGEAMEDLSWWDVSGKQLPALPLRVSARRLGTGMVEALLVAT